VPPGGRNPATFCSPSSHTSTRPWAGSDEKRMPTTISTGFPVTTGAMSVENRRDPPGRP
jgi:hypothetical protein